MPIYKQLHSVYTTPDNKKILVEIFDWAGMALSPEEFAQFNIDREEMNEYHNTLQQQEILKVEPILTQVTTNISGPIQLLIGYQYSFPENFIHHPKYLLWNEKFKNDPNVMYHDQILIG